jgi:hypothetical protein
MVTRIGCIEAGQGLTLCGPDGTRLDPQVRSFDHFA